MQAIASWMHLIIQANETIRPPPKQAKLNAITSQHSAPAWRALSSQNKNFFKDDDAASSNLHAARGDDIITGDRSTFEFL